MATVYLARDERHHRNVALKVLKPELAAVVRAERFLEEIETTKHLRHPHILPLLDSGEADSFLFYVMPYLDGESLRERLDRQRRLPVDEALQIARSAAGALDYAHRQAVVHGGITPANILLRDDQPVFSDFGIALAVALAGGGRLGVTSLGLGTLRRVSPGRANGDPGANAEADMYALGCVVYEMLVGERPIRGGVTEARLGKLGNGHTLPANAERTSVPRTEGTFDPVLLARSKSAA